MECPICSVELRMTYRDEVEIDYCPQCRGVWLDRGELEKIVERATMQTASTIDHDQRPRDRYDERSNSRDKGADRSYAKKKKRGSWLSELFEFGD